MRSPYVIQLYRPGREVDEFFFATRAEQDRQVSALRDLGIYQHIWWGYGPSENPEEWEEFGNWERTPAVA